MSHDPHEGADGTLVYDGCAECDSRAADPLEGLLHYDIVRFAQLHERMVNVEYRNADHYRSSNEARVCKALYYIRLLIDRNGDVLHAPRQDERPTFPPQDEWSEQLRG